jgi:hypothetical protein
MIKSLIAWLKSPLMAYTFSEDGQVLFKTYSKSWRTANKRFLKKTDQNFLDHKKNFNVSLSISKPSFS